MQITDFTNAIIDFPDGRQRLASFTAGVLSISGLGHAEALLVVKLIEHASRSRVAAKPSKTAVSPVVPTPMRNESVSMPLDPEPELPNAAAVPTFSSEPEEPEEPEETEEPEQTEEPEEPEEPEPAPKKRRRGRPPGSKNKPKIPEPEDDEQTQTKPAAGRRGLDPSKVEWPEEGPEDTDPVATTVAGAQGGKPQVSVTNPPSAVVGAAKNFKAIITALGDAGLMEEPIIYLSPETISLVNAQSQEHGPIEPGKFLNSNSYRWILAHREAIERGESGIVPLRLIAGKRSMDDLIAQLVRMIAFAN